jgi:hypothetical protein
MCEILMGWQIDSTLGPKISNRVWAFFEVRWQHMHWVEHRPGLDSHFIKAAHYRVSLLLTTFASMT